MRLSHGKRRILRHILQHSNSPATIGDTVNVLEAWEAIKLKENMR